METTAARPVIEPDRRVLTIPNALSALRLGAVPAFVWLFVAGHENTAVVVYALGAGTDFLDGYIARRTGSVTELGKLLDPLADRIFIVALTAVLVERDALSVWLAAAILARDVLLLAAWPLLERKGTPRIQVKLIGKVATACLLFGLTCLALGETSFTGSGLGDDIGTTFTLAGGILYWGAAIAYGREARDKLKKRDDAMGSPETHAEGLE
jgi:cardiolipin synthase